MTDLEEYEKEYLKRHENQKKENSVTVLPNLVMPL